jgi:hypothetical protein
MKFITIQQVLRRGQRLLLVQALTGTTNTISGLAINTTYYIWVRARCSSTDASPWSGPVTVFTNYVLQQEEVVRQLIT